MALNMVYFPIRSVTVLTIEAAPKFLARLITSDAKKLVQGSVVRTALLNATGGLLGTVLLTRVGQETYKLYLTDDNADALEAWIRQVSQAFDAEVVSGKVPMMPYLGDFAGQAPSRGYFEKKTHVTLINRGWISYAVGPEDALKSLIKQLTDAGVEEGPVETIEALRVMAREPASGLEYDETTSPLEAGLEDALDFSDSDRIFIGRALTQARFEAKDYERLHLVAFNVPFDPATLTEMPLVVVGELGYQPTSLVRIPEMNLTASLVRLPPSIEIGTTLDALVKTDPPCNAKSVLVVSPQA